MDMFSQTDVYMPTEHCVTFAVYIFLMNIRYIFFSQYLLYILRNAACTLAGVNFKKKSSVIQYVSLDICCSNINIYIRTHL